MKWSIRRLIDGACLAAWCSGSALAIPSSNAKSYDYDVVILGGGVAGIIAARTLHENGMGNFLIVEARDELGGRMRSYDFNGNTVELGANWVEGTQQDDGPSNPIYELALKHGLQTIENNWDDIAHYDESGKTDFKAAIGAAEEAYSRLVNSAGARVHNRLVDLTARSGYSLNDWKPRSHHEDAAEYYVFDWEYAQSPEQTSWIASSNANNYTFSPDGGGFSDSVLMSIDSRGFKHIILSEAEMFLKPEQTRLNSTVTRISYGEPGVTIQLQSGESITAAYALCTFSVGVLQHDDVIFEPQLPGWKQEALQVQTMGTYTKLFLQFDEKFWDESEMSIYADPYQRGYYPVWQSLDHDGFIPGSKIYMATVTGDQSERVEKLSDEQVRDELMAVLKTMYPNVNVPEPTSFYFHRWFNDPLYRGSFANWPAAFFAEHQDNIRAPVGRLYFAGEATSFKYYGYLHGAYTEGLSVAEAIVNCAQKGDCSFSLVGGGPVQNCNREVLTRREL